MSNITTIGKQASEPLPAHDQSQSSLFTKLPLDIRRHIYLQLWLDCGLTQHIFTFGENSYLGSYPCIISDWDKDPGPRPSEQLQDEQLENEGPPPLDDPGDIDGAIEDITARPPSPTIDDGIAVGSPWCMHRPCFQSWMEKWGQSYSEAYSATYRSNSNSGSSQVRDGPGLRSSPLLLSLLVCKRMFQEASESMFSTLRFSFSTQDRLDRFLSDVPRGLTERIQFVEIMTGPLMLHGTRQPLNELLQTACNTMKEAFPKLTELRLTIHPTHRGDPLPTAETLAPLYALAQESKSLRKFDVRLPCICDCHPCDLEEPELFRGDIPDFLKEAPFNAVIVPQGWHPVNDCVFWIHIQ